MQYHIEHHMFPMVPYYNLPQLHEVLKTQLPKPYGSIWEVYKEMIPALVKQSRPHKEDKDGNAIEGPLYFTDRRGKLPPPLATNAATAELRRVSGLTPDKHGWVAACETEEVAPGEVERFDVGPRTYCVYHAEDDGLFYATAGKCTHGAAALSDGLVTGNLIECPKHNGCFDFKTGQPKRLPVKTRLATFPTKVEGGTVFVQVDSGKHVQVSYDEDGHSSREQQQGQQQQQQQAPQVKRKADVNW